MAASWAPNGTATSVSRTNWITHLHRTYTSQISSATYPASWHMHHRLDQIMRLCLKKWRRKSTCTLLNRNWSFSKRLKTPIISTSIAWVWMTKQSCGTWTVSCTMDHYTWVPKWKKWWSFLTLAVTGSWLKAIKTAMKVAKEATIRIGQQTSLSNRRRRKIEILALSYS